MVRLVCFRPLIRGFFFYACTHKRDIRMVRGVSVPSFGDSFFMWPQRRRSQLERSEGFRPLIRGFFFYVSYSANSTAKGFQGFRPLIRGFFFYKKMLLETTHVSIHVSVPSFGDSFFIRMEEICNKDFSDSFRPLIRGFFFYCDMRLYNNNSKLEKFPSPHSGILFLSTQDLPMLT